MKSTRRHELQRNMLEVELLKWWEFLRKRGNYIAWGGLGVAAVVLVVVWYVRRVRAEEEAGQTQYTRLVQMQPRTQQELQDKLQGLELLAGKTAYPKWAAAACVKAGDLYAFRIMTEWPQRSVARDDLRSKAQSSYQRVIDTFPREEMAVAQARYGLGKLAESFGDLDTARSNYQMALQMGAGLGGQPVGALVEEALRRMELFRGKVYMPASAPAEPTSTSTSTSTSTPATSQEGGGPATGPATGPSSEPATVPSSGPATGPASKPARAPVTAPAPRTRPSPQPSSEAATRAESD